MEPRTGTNTVIAVVLILLGLAFFVFQIVPTPQGGSWLEQTWPLVLVLIGAALLVLSQVRHAPGMAIPAATLAGLGGLLYWQNATWDWESWAYVWTLIPGFVGIGFLLAVLLGGPGSLLAHGEGLIVISVGLFALFTTFYSTFGFVGPSWPLLAIGVGVLLLVRSAVLLASTPSTTRPAVHKPVRGTTQVRHLQLGRR